MLTGEVGAGKTTVCRHLTDQLHPGLFRVHYVSLTTDDMLDMYKSIAGELGLSVERSRSSAHHSIRTETSRLATEARQLPVLVVDEAHHLRNDVLEDLRPLTNFAMDSENRMCLILVGLTELRRPLSMAVHESLAQRRVVRHHLAGLGRDEVDAYVRHRLTLAGCELPLFEETAVEALFQATRGLPRQINRIAHYALSAAALRRRGQSPPTTCRTPSRSSSHERHRCRGHGDERLPDPGAGRAGGPPEITAVAHRRAPGTPGGRHRRRRAQVRQVLPRARHRHHRRARAAPRSPRRPPAPGRDGAARPPLPRGPRPLVRLHGVDENTVAEVAHILGFLRDIQRRFEAAVLLVHHARKNGATRPCQALRGSSELHAWGDSNLYLRRRDRQIVMTVEHRAAPGPQ